MTSFKFEIRLPHSYVSVHDPGKMFSKQVLGTPSFNLKSAHISVCAVWRIVYNCATCEVIVDVHYPCWWVVCVLSPAHLVHVLVPYRSIVLEGVLRGSFCSENMVSHCSRWNCSSGNTILFRTSFILQEMVCTENMFREHVPAGTVPRTSVNARECSTSWHIMTGLVNVPFA